MGVGGGVGGVVVRMLCLSSFQLLYICWINDTGRRGLAPGRTDIWTGKKGHKILKNTRAVI